MKNFSVRISTIATGTLLVLVSACSVTFAQNCDGQYCGTPQYGSHQCGRGCAPSMGQLFRAGYDANVQWPSIYIPPARQSVCATYSAMINNGWRRQNLLGDYHFNQDTNELTNAGKLKVNWILSQAPVQRRNVFVQRGDKEVQTVARVSAVHEYAGNMSPSRGNVDVNDTHIVAEGHLASSVDSVFVGYEANRLPPVLPTGTSGGEEQ